MTRLDKMYIGALLLLCIGAAISTCGCSSALKNAAITVTTNATLARNAGEMLSDLDKEKQEAIEAKMWTGATVEQAKAERDAWRLKREPAVKALKVLNGAVVAASVAVSLAAQGDKLDLIAALAPVLKAAKALADALKAFGLKIPGVPL
jgi:ABC-type glycerol-3-phosphate transport system substrate-binding protein